MQTEKSCGAAVFTIVNGVRHYVLTDHINGGNCGMPKGHVEAGETEHQTALREIWEETCVKAEIVEGFREAIEYVMPNGNLKQVVYFIAKFDHQQPRRNPDDVNDVKFLPFDEALNALTFEETKKIFRLAEDWLNKQAGL